MDGEVVFKCNCHDHHYITVEWMDAGPDDNPAYRYLDFCTVQGTDRIRTRIANAIRVLVGKQVITACISLNDANCQKLYSLLGTFHDASQ